MNIQPEFLSLAKLLDSRLFLIPDYQRCYSWQESQRQDLFSDITRLYKKGNDEGHFMATIVCLRKGKVEIGVEEFTECEVVDGQQRITTLIILLQAINLSIREDEKYTKVTRDLSELLVKPEGNHPILLQTNHDSSYYFANYLRKGISSPSKEAETIADQRILKAIEDCTDFVESWKAEYPIQDLLKIINNRLHFLLHSIEDARMVYTVFEVLNSRGLAVSWFDRLKSILMGNAYELVGAPNDHLIKNLHNIWRDIYKEVGLRTGISAEALKFSATLKAETRPSKPLGEEASVDTLRAYASTAEEINSTAEWLRNVVLVCNKVLENPRINSISHIAQTRLLAVAIMLRKFPSNDEKDILIIWEKVVFKIYGLLGKDARSSVGDFVRLAWDVTNSKLSPKEIIQRIKEIGGEYSLEKAIEGIRGANCYNGWERELRYLLFRYEEHLWQKDGLNFSNETWVKIWKASPARSIEHVWPQSNAPDEYVHRLGNLTLLPPGLNSKLKDKPPADKAESYYQTGLKVAGQISSIINKNGWMEEQVEEREASIIKWVQQEWSV